MPVMEHNTEFAFLSGKSVIIAIEKGFKSKSAPFKDALIGDIIQMSLSIKSDTIAKIRSAYAINVMNLRTGEKGMYTANQLCRIVEHFELRPIE